MPVIKKLWFAKVLSAFLFSWNAMGLEASGLKPDKFELAVQRSGQAAVYQRLAVSGKPESSGVLGSKVRAPMGSLWKLFVSYYLLEQKIRPQAYTCSGQKEDEIFCCKPKEKIDFEEALSKSCGPYFSPERLGISEISWQQFWEVRQQTFPWLKDLSKLQPKSEVPVIEVLQVLESMKSKTESFEKLNSILARVTIDGTAKGKFRKLGSLLRVKTYTWDHPSEAQKLIGGFAGWLSDGAVIWGRGVGTSSQVLANMAGPLAQLAESTKPSISNECVVVSFFDRYPLRSVTERASKKMAATGILRGAYQAEFQNGNKLDFHSQGELRLQASSSGELLISGHLDLNQYVARVLDREASASPLEAARALSLVVRTYLYQNAAFENGCWKIADSTRLQRVSVNPASTGSLKVASWSHELVIRGVPQVRYNHSQPGQNNLAWIQAVQMAKNGIHFDEILKTAYPAMQISSRDDLKRPICERLVAAEKWLTRQRSVWRASLTGMSGYQEPGLVRICKSSGLQPYSDQEQNTIYMRFVGEHEDHLTAAHEFLHLGFKYHPNGLNETFIESKARELLVGKGQVINYEGNE